MCFCGLEDEAMQDSGLDKNIEISTEEYKRKIKDIFDKMDDNRKLRFWYRYISEIEKG